jgi:hypothetical protein
MKILEAERWLKGTNSHGVAFLQRQGGKTAGIPHPGAWKVLELALSSKEANKGERW